MQTVNDGNAVEQVKHSDYHCNVITTVQSYIAIVYSFSVQYMEHKAE